MVGRIYPLYVIGKRAFEILTLPKDLLKADM
jgi:hypothetical protein